MTMGQASRTPAQDMKILTALPTTDIGGTNATSRYLDVSEYGAITFVAYLGDGANPVVGWDSSDLLDGFKLKEATDAGGTSATDITGAANAAAIGTAGLTAWITCRTSALTITGTQKKFVAAYVSEAGNTGVDKVTITAILHDAHYHYDQLSGPGVAIG
jgi:hypothetical protein